MRSAIIEGTSGACHVHAFSSFLFPQMPPRHVPGTPATGIGHRRVTTLRGAYRRLGRGREATPSAIGEPLQRYFEVRPGHRARLASSQHFECCLTEQAGQIGK